MKKVLLILAIIALAGASWFFFFRTETKQSVKTDGQQAQAKPFDKNAKPIDDPNSIWVIVNKRRPLSPKEYAPTDLVAPDVALRLTARDQEMMMRKEVADALKALFAGAKKDGNDLMVASAYRPYTMQENLYSRYVAQQGQAAADTQSARPGFSEHQTGLAVDVEPADRSCEVEVCFADTPAGKWIAANAYKYGFTLRYHQGQDDVTGYMYEPWHIRYVGKELAEELHRQGDPTLEQFFDLEPAPDYVQ